MRTVRFVIDTDLHPAGRAVSLEDQAATNAIASGAAVPYEGEPDIVVAVLSPQPAAKQESEPVEPAEVAGTGTAYRLKR